MATFKTPEELRAWSRSFYDKSKIIKRDRYNYISPDDEKDENNKSNNSNIDANSIAESIIAKGNASNANISELFSLDSSTIDSMNSKFPSTEQQLSKANTTDLSKQ